jgi:hypothetical protein
LFFSYTMSVILLSLSMYGIWCFLHDVWQWWLEPHFASRPSCSFLVVVKNLDGEIEDVFRYLTREIEHAEIDCDIVVVDVSCNDFTSAVLERVENDSDVIKVVTMPAGKRAIGEAMALCRGSVVHVMDLSNRMSVEEFMVTVRTLLRQGSHEVIIRKVAK